jgi:hypothetical protein
LLAGLRRFAAATRAIEASWCANACSGDSWRPTGPEWQTNNRPVQLVNGSGLLGVQKPGDVAPTNSHTAATEKIVADLAAVIGLPVPPVTLWDRGSATAGFQFVSVSAWAFEQPLTWAQDDALFCETTIKSVVCEHAASGDRSGNRLRSNEAPAICSLGRHYNPTGRWRFKCPVALGAT